MGLIDTVKRNKRLAETNSALLQQINKTNFEKIDRYTLPIIFNPTAGFAYSGSSIIVVHSDVNAAIYTTFKVPETRTDWKLSILSWSTISSRTDSGLISAGKAAVGGVDSDTNIFNGVNMDLVHVTNLVHVETKTSVFSATKNDTIRALWIKDDNPGTGSLIILAVILTYD